MAVARDLTVKVHLELAAEAIDRMITSVEWERGMAAESITSCEQRLEMDRAKLARCDQQIAELQQLRAKA